jgi:hypothetical protein
VSLLRSFEIAKVQGTWQSLEIRKHQIRLLSDTITEAKYTDGVTLATLVDDHATLAAKLKELEAKEKQEGVLLKEKRELELKIAAYNAQDATRAEIRRLKEQIAVLTEQQKVLSSQHQEELISPFNYYCTLSFQNGGDGLRVQVFGRGKYLGLGSGALELTDQPINAWQKVKFTPTGDGYYLLSFQAGQVGGDVWRVQLTGREYRFLELTGQPINTWQKVKFTPTGDGYYLLSFQAGGDGLRVQVIERNYLALEVTDQPINAWQKVKLISTGEQTNNNIGYAFEGWQLIVPVLNQAEEELKKLNAALTATPADKAAWDARLNQVIALITALQTELNTLNTDFLNAVKNTQVKPQTMPQVTKDGKGLVTQAALLGFVQPASRLNALATCEGNVQLSYLDRDGRMRQTRYDATADGNNAAFEQWIPDAQRACLNFSNGNSLITVNPALYLPEDWSIEAWFVHPLPAAGEWNTLIRGKDTDHLIKVRNRSQLGIYLNQDPLGQGFYDSGFNMNSLSEGWHHVAAVGRGDTTLFYIDGKKVGDLKAKACKDAAEALTKDPKDAAAKQRLEALKGAVLKSRSNVYAIGNYQGGGQPFGKVAEVRIWGVALSDEEIAVNSTLTLSGNEPGLIAYYPMDEATGVEVRDHSGNGHNATVAGASWWGCTAAIGKIDNPGANDAVVCAEYSTVTLSSFSQAKVAMMRRFFAYPATNGVTLLPDQRIETLELKWIGNAQFAPTLLGYMEGPPPVPSENLTLSDDYNGATSVELTMSEDVEFNWNRSQDAGLGASVDTFIGAGGTMSILTAPMGVGTSIDTSARIGFKGNFDFSYQFQNESSITSSSSLSMTDKLELRGTPEETVKFPHLGTRFIPKNIGYALVVSALADVFVTRLARSGKMVGYQVQPVDGIPPDVNTITFLMNPAYTMNGSLDGMTGSSATSDRFFKHVPEMRSQYGSLYPASYYRLKEAYDLKRSRG